MSWSRKKASQGIILYICLIASLISIPFQSSLAAEESDWLEVVQTDTGYSIHSITQNGNLSFSFEFVGKEPTRIAFVNRTGHYAIEYILPVEIWEYEDTNENGYFDYTYSEWKSSLYGNVLNETVFAYYKNFWFSEITKIITRNDGMGNVVCEWSINGSAGLSHPWPEREVLIPIKYTFRYHPLNGSLKTDFSLENFASKSETSRLFIEFSMQYTSEQSERVEVVINQEKLEANSVNDQHKLNSTTIFLTANGKVKGFFDFGGKLEIDNSTATLIGAVVPWIERGYQYFSPTYAFSTAIGIQLSYPHVNKALTHDPSFGLKTSLDVEQKASPTPNYEPSWKIPLIATTVLIATIIVTTIILRQKRASKLQPSFKFRTKIFLF